MQVRQGIPQLLQHRWISDEAIPRSDQTAAGPSSGLIATGDRFIGDPAVLQKLRDALPDLQAVEMEGAAVAQVAEQEGIPWLVLRVISDGADETAAQSFEDFVKRYEQQAWRLIEALLQRCKDAPRRCA